MKVDDLTGKLVRWENEGQWFTATVDGTGVMRGSWRGTVVDPGNFTDTVHPYFEEHLLKVGEHVPNLLSSLITVVSDAD